MGHYHLPTPQSMKRIYSLSRRFDLTTVFIIVALWAAVLTLCRILAFTRPVTAYFSVLLLVVALAQFLLSPLGRPRTVSVVAGAAHGVVGSLVLTLTFYIRSQTIISSEMLKAFFFPMMIGSAGLSD